MLLQSSNNNLGSSRSSPKRGLKDPFYCDTHLARNNIYWSRRNKERPEQVVALQNYIFHQRASPGPWTERVWEDWELRDLGQEWSKSKVKSVLENRFFPDPTLETPPRGLKRTDKTRMSEHAVPHSGSRFKVKTPRPNMLYGYEPEVFTRTQVEVGGGGVEILAANADRMLFPFLVVELRGDGESMMAARNACLGTTASCVNFVERLNARLEVVESTTAGGTTLPSQSDIQQVNSAVFSIIANSTIALVNITWKENQTEDNYFMTLVKGFVHGDPDGYIEFRKCILNILDWGMTERLNEIREALDVLAR
ncbi:hypothetical protein B0H66DRAFT_581734 [Apodospora peruviana]|uniref:DUF7924 domain-containing protein n=1 Tax=Apodospora peruviana TaxID=516989 RepID=A0AAE0ICU9_9PEZI|nr:hypothetical protein B0H66DRAFT_581734 [Apodospora peruviana]